MEGWLLGRRIEPRELRSGLVLLVKVGLLVTNGDGSYKFSGAALLRIDAARAGLSDALANGDADTYSLRRYSAETGLSESRVKEAIQELVRKGYIARGAMGHSSLRKSRY